MNPTPYKPDSRNHARRLSRVSPRWLLCACLLLCAFSSPAFADRLHLLDGTTVEADEVWDDPQGVWYRQGGVSYFIARARVKNIERAGRTPDAVVETTKRGQVARLVELNHAAAPNSEAATVVNAALNLATSSNTNARSATPPVAQLILIRLVGGASFEVDEIAETADGIWYKRGSLSIFIERARIERIERERTVEKAEPAIEQLAAKRERRWSTGRPQLDALIRQNGARFGVDPYLIFCVMEQESHFNAGAVSPMGARGLMQLMPGTAARFGVRNSHDPAQNIAGGTRFLKQLLGRFGGRVDLVLASYNAGEGAVLKYGRRVPPYRETRNYVRKISSRYGNVAHAPAALVTAVKTRTP